MSAQNQPNPSPKQQNMGMAILAYFGPLVIVSYAMAKDDPFVKFHMKQGLVLLAIEVIVFILGTIMWQLWFILELVNIVILVLAIIGIVNAAQGKEAKLPVVGDLAKIFTF